MPRRQWLSFETLDDLLQMLAADDQVLWRTYSLSGRETMHTAVYAGLDQALAAV